MFTSPTESFAQELIAACHEPGCPVCRVLAKRVRNYLDKLFYEHVNDLKLREELRLGRGFCRTHAWMALEMGVGDALGVAIIYHDVLTNVLRLWPSGVGVSGGGGMLERLRRGGSGLRGAARNLAVALRPQGPCPACQQEADQLDLAVAVLMEAATRPELAAALEGSAGLCLPHFGKALGGAQTEAQAAELLRLEEAKLAALDAELAELIRKNDYRFRDEAIGAEGDSWKRAVRMVVGEQDIT
jgi:hypothetical protein